MNMDKDYIWFHLCQQAYGVRLKNNINAGLKKPSADALAQAVKDADSAYDALVMLKPEYKPGGWPV